MRKRIVGTLGVLLVTLGCASTQMTSSWKSPQYAGQLPKKVLVVALIPDQAVANGVEQQAAQSLQKEGVTTAPFSQFHSGTAGVTKDEVKDVMARNGFDGLLVSSFKGTDEKVNMPAYGYGPYFSRYGPYAYGAYGYGGGYADVTTEHKMETSLYDAKSGEGTLLWTGTSTTIPSGSPKEDVSKYVSTVLDRMNKDLVG